MLFRDDHSITVAIKVLRWTIMSRYQFKSYQDDETVAIVVFRITRDDNHVVLSLG
jgi:hypothetical protein